MGVQPLDAEGRQQGQQRAQPRSRAYHAGRAEAERDLARGEPRWLTYGLPTGSR